jgi:ankyrin repeat protein
MLDRIMHQVLMHNITQGDLQKVQDTIGFMQQSYTLTRDLIARNAPGSGLSLPEVVDLNQQDEKGMTALTLACSRGHVEIVRHLLDYKADVNVPNRAGELPLHLAIFEGEIVTSASASTPRASTRAYFTIAELLVERSANVNSPMSHSIVSALGECKATPLLWAIDQNKIKQVNFLATTLRVDLSACARVSETQRVSALFHAIHKNHADLVRVLVEDYRVKVINVYDSDGASPLTAAIFSLRQKQAADYASYGLILSGYADALIRFLVTNLMDDKGAGANVDVNTPDEKGRIPLTLAAESGLTSVVEFLISKGADVNLTASLSPRTALMHAAYSGHINTVSTLLDNKADARFLFEEKSSALDYVIRNNNINRSNIFIIAVMLIQHKVPLKPSHIDWFEGNIPFLSLEDPRVAASLRELCNLSKLNRIPLTFFPEQQLFIEKLETFRSASMDLYEFLLELPFAPATQAIVRDYYNNNDPTFEAMAPGAIKYNNLNSINAALTHLMVLFRQLAHSDEKIGFFANTVKDISKSLLRTPQDEAKKFKVLKRP